MKEILKYLRKADEDFSLIDNNDYIVVGVSGGKDSIALLYALHLYTKFKEKSFKIIGIHMNMGFEDTSIEIIDSFVKKYEIPFKSIDVPIYDILKHYRKEDGTLDCARCSNLKRGAIVNIAKELKANKVAFAHHGDDAIETLLMNMIYSAKVDTFKPKIEYEDNEITFIRPFVYVNENKISQVVKKYEMPICSSGCPNDGNTSRADIKNIMKQIYDLYPKSRKNLIKSLTGEKEIWKTENRK